MSRKSPGTFGWCRGRAVQSQQEHLRNFSYNESFTVAQAEAALEKSGHVRSYTDTLMCISLADDEEVDLKPFRKADAFDGD